MNAYVNTEASCAALAARYLRSAFGTLGGSGGSTEVRRLQSMAQVGVDVFQTQLQIEEHQQVLERLKEQGRALQRSATASAVEKRAVYHQAIDAEKQLATLRKSMQILETTMNNIENTAVMQRLHRVMQDTMARHQQMSSQHSEENALHSEVTQAFDQLTNDVQSGINSMDEMSTNIDIMAAQDPLHAQKLTEAQWFSALEPALVRQTGLAETSAGARAQAPSEQSVGA